MIKNIKAAWGVLLGVEPLPTIAETEQLRADAPQIQIGGMLKHTNRRTFSAGNVNRLTSSWLTQDIALNTLLESQLAIIRARSRKLGRDTATGKRFLSLVKNNIVGPDGFQLQSRCGDYRNGKWVLDDLANQVIEQHFKIWCRAEHCDITGQSSFPETTRMLTEGLARDGEFLVREIIGTKDTPYRYQLQVLNVDRLDLNYRGTATNGNTIRMGVERNSAGKPVAYYVLERNPNDALSNNTQAHVRIAATDIIHKFIRVDPEQIRGVPWAHAIMTGQNMLHMFEEAAVTAAVVGASNMGFYEPPAPGDAAYVPPNEDAAGYGAEVADDEDASGNLMKDAVGGAFETLPPGWKFSKFDPNYPHAAFDPFVQSRKRDIASGLDVAHHNLSGDMSGVNYSSARIAELQERDCWRAGQQFMINAFVMRVAERWLEFALLGGALTMPNGSSLPAIKIDKFKAGLGFTARGWDWVDPLKEVTAAKVAIEEGLATRTQVVASKGGDFEENIIELEREMALLKQHGITLGAKVQTPAQNQNTDSENQDQKNPNGDSSNE
jgi:lambda family phage portal protein